MNYDSYKNVNLLKHIKKLIKMTVKYYQKKNKERL